MSKPYSLSPKGDLEIAAGLGIVEGVETFSMYGAVDDPAAGVLTDVAIDIAGVEVALPDFAGESLEIVSSDPADTATMALTGLGPNGKKLAADTTVVLNGATPVAIPGLFSRVNFLTCASDEGIAGDVQVRRVGGTPVYITATEEAQQSQQALFSVPAGWKAQVTTLVGSMQKSQGVDTDAVIVAQLKGATQQKWRRPFAFGMQRSGNTATIFDNRIPSTIEGPADIKLSTQASAAGAVVSGWISGLITRAGGAD